MDDIAKGDNVLLVWAGQLEPKQLEEFVTKVKSVSEKDVCVENIEVFEARENHFDITFIGEATPTMSMSFDDWAKILKSLKPSGRIVVTTEDAAAATKHLKLNGFTNVTDAKVIDGRVQVRGEKPNFNVGASVQLKLSDKNNKAEVSGKKVWTLDSDDENDIVDEDSLLAEEDKEKPNREDLKCATTGKKKACKNCTCGLAEELDREAQLKKVASEQPKSSCGSCYLGDAFRCASCPYRGLPAFRPGEKIQLDPDLLKADA